MPRSGEDEAMVLDMTCEEWPHQRWKDGRPLTKLLKESHCETLEKDSDLRQVTRWVYFKMHFPEFDHESSDDLSHTFWEIAMSIGLIDSDVHEVQDVWTGQKDLRATHHVAKRSPKDIHYF